MFNGLAQVIVQAGSEPGQLQLRAHAEGLADDAIVIEMKGHGGRPEAAR